MFDDRPLTAARRAAVRRAGPRAAVGVRPALDECGTACGRPVAHDHVVGVLAVRDLRVGVVERDRARARPDRSGGRRSRRSGPGRSERACRTLRGRRPGSCRRSPAPASWCSRTARAAGRRSRRSPVHAAPEAAGALQARGAELPAPDERGDDANVVRIGREREVDRQRGLAAGRARHDEHRGQSSERQKTHRALSRTSGEDLRRGGEADPPITSRA